MDFSHPNIMGILNITPDSFSDGGDFLSFEPAQKRLQEMIQEGADMIDIGGESTGPGSIDVSLEEEMKRIQPIIDYVHQNNLFKQVIFSIDTYKADIAQYALQKGFQIVNDVTALRGDVKMLDVLLSYKPYVILMYSKDSTPRTTRNVVEYKDVVDTIKTFLSERIEKLVQAGFPKEKIIIDPGMGMFVSAKQEYSFEIIQRLSEFQSLGCPLCIGVSRKSFLGGSLKERESASIEWSLKAVQNGASIVRVHSVALMKKALNQL